MMTEHPQTCHVSVKGLHAACSVTATSDPAKKWNRKKGNEFLRIIFSIFIIIVSESP